ncbi:MAG: hypothetical protein JKX76_00955 [Colwellia sp.]|nr:hypothetical protein [Colwellia sp.]
MKFDWKKFLIVIVVYTVSIVVLAGFDSKIMKGEKGKDTWNKCVFNVQIMGDNCISWWPISHFIMFFLIGAIFPSDWLVYWFIGGIYWELLETMAGKMLYVKSARESCDNCQYKKWLDGAFTDILFNGTGLLVGWGMRELVLKGMNKSDQ